MIESAALSKTGGLASERAVSRQGRAGGEVVAKIHRANSEDIHIGEKTSFEGSFDTQGTIFVDGHLTKASVQAWQLSIGPRGCLEGEVTVNRAEIGGEFSGRLTVAAELVLRSSARIAGEIACAELVTHRGAEVRAQVTSRIGESEPAAATVSAAGGPLRSHSLRRRASLAGAFALGALVAGGTFGTILLFRLAPMMVP